MSDIKDTTYSNTEPVVIQEQPKAPAQPTYSAPAAGQFTEDWQNDIFDCFKGPEDLCLKATFCPCFVYGKTEHRRRDPTMTGYERINNDCLMWGGAQACCGVGWVFNFIRRGEIRNQYNIKGDTVTDCLFSAFCHCCALIQQEKEVIGRQAGHGDAVNKEGYVKPESMGMGGAGNGMN